MFSYLIYEDREHHQLKWYQRLLKRGFRHVWMMVYDGIGWYKIERIHGYMDVANVYLLDEEMISNVDVKKYMEERGCVVQEVNLSWFREEGMRTPHLLTVSNCVECVKDVLGIKGFFLMTPLQLFNYIERNKP